ncbi:MAG: hypothetical protein SFW36_09800 [Leptolyngbyaceae cyanobacterium bins.59]|nr:hypothetical protein [Leptolyngbyaceae cyanobacterium bins.59]
MGWQSYGLDQIAQRLVLDAKERDEDSLNQGYKMRMATAYGLERFWGEHLRLQRREPEKAEYWKATWDALVRVMGHAGVIIPNDLIDVNDVRTIRAMSAKLWGETPLNAQGRKLTLQDQRVALAVLSQLCDCIVWWTQRYK